MMNFTTNITLNLLLLQGISLVFLSVLTLGNRYRNHQPLERIRLFLWSLAAIGVVALLLFVPLGPRWTFSIPVAEIPKESHSVENNIQIPVDAARKVVFIQEVAQTTPQIIESRLVSEPISIDVPQINMASTIPMQPFLENGVKMQPEVVESPAPKKGVKDFSFVLFGFCVPAIWLLLCEVVAKFKLHRITKRSVAPDKNVRKLFEPIAATAQRKIDLRLSAEIETPMIFGFFNAVLLIPQKMLESPQEIQAALAHEFSHFRRGDLRSWFFVRLFQYLLWPQPFYWQLRRQLLMDQDFLADHDAAEQLADRTDYAEILCNLAKARKTSANVLAMAASKKSQLTRRIEMILGLAKEPLELTLNKRRLVTPLIILFVLMLLGGAVRIGENKADEKTNDNNLTSTSASDTTSDSERKSVQKKQSLLIDKENDDLYSVSGIIYDGDGTPASEAEVLLYEAEYGGPKKAAKTDAEGKFYLETKKLFLLVARSKDEKNIFVYKFSETPESDKIPAILRPGEKLTGQVVDKNGKPVEDATVGYEGIYRTNRMIQTDVEGRFTLHFPEVLGVNSVFAMKPGEGFKYKIYAADMNETFPAPNQEKEWRQPIRFQFGDVKPIRLTMRWDDGTAASGVTITPWTLKIPGVPRPNSEVSSDIYNSTSFNFAMYQYFERKTTDANGVAVFDWTPADLNHIEFFYKIGPWKGNEEVKRLRLNFEYSPIDPHEKMVIIYRTKKLKGTVRYPDGQVAEGISVEYNGGKLSLEHPSGSTKTDAQGRYELEVDPETLMLLGVKDDQWTAPAFNPIVVNKDTMQEELDAFDFTLQKKTRVHGVVKFGTENQKLRGKKLALELMGKSDENLPKEKQLTRPEGRSHDIRCYFWYSTPIDDEGNYSIDLGPGEYELSVNESYIGADNFLHDLLPEGTKLTVTENKSEQVVDFEHNIQANESLNGSIRGKVVLSNGKPAVNAELRGVFHKGPRYVYRSSTPDFTATTDAQGNYDAPRTLEPMKLLVRSEDEKEGNFVSLAKDTSQLGIVLKPVFSATGTMIDIRTKKPVGNMSFFYGIQVYGIGFEGNKDFDEQFGYPYRFPGELRFGGAFQTDAQGRFQLENLIPHTEYQLVFRPRKDIRRSESETFQIRAFKTDNGPKIDLGNCEINAALLDGAPKPDETIPQFTVLLLDDETGKPIPDAEVHPQWSINAQKKLHPIPGSTAHRESTTEHIVGNYRTDTSGKATFLCLPPQYRDRYDTSNIELNIKGGNRYSELDRSPYITGYTQILGGFDKPQEFTIRLKKYPSVSGKILDSDGKPLDGAILKFSTIRETDAEKLPDGSMRFPVASGSKHFETATRADGTFTALTAVDFTKGTLIVIPQENGSTSFDLKGKSATKADDWVFRIPAKD